MDADLLSAFETPKAEVFNFGNALMWTGPKRNLRVLKFRLSSLISQITYLF